MRRTSTILPVSDRNSRIVTWPSPSLAGIVRLQRSYDATPELVVLARAGDAGWPSESCRASRWRERRVGNAELATDSADLQVRS